MQPAPSIAPIVVRLSGSDVIEVDGVPAGVGVEVRQYHGDHHGDDPVLFDGVGFYAVVPQPPDPAEVEPLDTTDLRVRVLIRDGVRRAYGVAPHADGPGETCRCDHHFTAHHGPSGEGRCGEAGCGCARFEATS